MARRIVRGAVALFALIAWALPCHDREVAKAADSGAASPKTASASSAAAAEATADSASVRADIDTGNSNFMKAWLTGDAALFANCFAEDGAMLRPGGRLITGRDAIRARMEQVFQQFRAVSASATTQNIYVLGDRVYETGRWIVTAGPVGKPAAAESDSGSYVQIWRKEGAAWKLWRNVNVE